MYKCSAYIFFYRNLKTNHFFFKNNLAPPPEIKWCVPYSSLYYHCISEKKSLFVYFVWFIRAYRFGTVKKIRYVTIRPFVIWQCMGIFHLFCRFLLLAHFYFDLSKKWAPSQFMFLRWRHKFSVRLMVILPRYRARKSDAFRSRRHIFLREVSALLLERASRVLKIRTWNKLQRGSWGLRNGDSL